MISGSKRSHDPYSTTRWSVVMHSAASPSARADIAFSELAQRYWYPVYAYVRRCGHTPAIANDIVCAFLAHLMRKVSGRGTSAPHGDFRRYLLDRLSAFLASDWCAAVDVDAPTGLVVPTDLEAHYEHDAVRVATPEQAYQHAFALEVMARAFHRLRAEANAAGHSAMYGALEPYLVEDPGPEDYDAISRRLNSGRLVLVVALKRLRQRFRELVDKELLDTVVSAEEFVAEQTALHAALSTIRVTR